MAFNWVGLIKVAVLAALASNPKTAPIADEVSDAAAEAEKIFKKGSSGPEKLQHVVNVAKEAAQASDELVGGEDEIPGHVSQAVAAGVAAANAVKSAVEDFKKETPPPV